MFVEANTPKLVPANRFVPETARACTTVFAKPELADVQLVPLFVVTKAPPLVPAIRVVPYKTPPYTTYGPDKAKALTVLFVTPEFAAVQLAPLFVERKTPP